MTSGFLTFLVLSAFALAAVGAWAMVRVGSAHDKAMADVVEAKADQIVRDLEMRQSKK